ncbi:MAG: hypothetical protein HKO62_02525, partial [Gammaproteobacteria bacterium]|nr:hypothetical protein [Gammaproteobacteria bacterium]
MKIDLGPWLRGCAAATCTLLMPGLAAAYPIDGYEHTGIGRLEAARRIEAGEHPGRKQPAGALLPTESVDIRLTGHADQELPDIDAGFTRQIVALLGEYADRYAISVLDMSDPDNLRYAEHQ